MRDNDVSADQLQQRLRHFAQARRALPGPHYTTVLEWIHRSLRPETYVEIGVQNGDSLRIAGPDTLCVGIDPEPTITAPLSANTRLFPLTSDGFFATHDLAGVLGCDHFALAFIDGLHAFEQALLDFINLEQFSSPGSVVLLHDCIPLDRVTSDRTRTTDFYSGDVWKLALCLSEQRRDLRIVTIPTGPTGLCVVDGLNRHATSRQQYDAWVARYVGLDFEDYRMHLFRMPPAIPNTRDAVSSHLSHISSH
jgi:predicted O-methyltransferase YrrM